MCSGRDLGLASTVPSVERSVAYERVRTRHLALAPRADGCGSGRGVGFVYRHGFGLRPDPHDLQARLTRRPEGSACLTGELPGPARGAGTANRWVIAAVLLVTDKRLRRGGRRHVSRCRNLNWVLWPVNLRWNRHSPAAAIDDPKAVYALGSSSGENARLQRQAEELLPIARCCLTGLVCALATAPSMSAADRAGSSICWPSGLTPGGRVVGLDADPAHVAMASEFVASRGLSDVEVVCGDARHTDLESGSFDLVHARTLLITVPQPVEVLREMVRLARPGGWVAGLEPDTQASICYPPHPAFDRLCEIFTFAFSRNGADPHFGRRMAALYRQAGLRDITVEVRAGVYPAGHSRRTIRADLVRSMRPQIIELGLADEQELDELDAAARKHFEDPDVLVMPSLNFLAWGRKPTSV